MAHHELPMTHDAVAQYVHDVAQRSAPPFCTGMAQPEAGKVFDIIVPLRGTPYSSYQTVHDDEQLLIPEGMEGTMLLDGREIRVTDYRRRNYGEPGLRIRCQPTLDIQIGPNPTILRLHKFGIIFYHASPEW